MAKIQNTFKHIEEEKEIKIPTKRGFWRNLAEWDFTIDQDFLFRIMPYILYVSFFGIIYIANRHYTERVVREVTQLSQEVEEYQIQYHALQTRYVYDSRRQVVAKKAERLGLKEREKPLVRISE